MHVDPRCGLHQHRTGRTHGSVEGAEVGQLVGIRTAPAYRLNLGGQRQVDQEDPAPPWAGDEVAAEERADGDGNAGESGPCSDRVGPIAGCERRGDDRQAAGGQQGTSDALQGAAPIRIVMFGARAHSAEASANQVTPTVKTHRRP